MTVDVSNLLTETTVKYTNEEQKKDELKDSFLKILVAQLQHQDPLSPMENTEFTSQLAQFYQLEETRSSNRYLEEISKNLNTTESNTIKDPYSYIDAEVTARINDTIYMQNGKAQLPGYYELTETGRVRISIYDSSGKLVETIEEDAISTGTKTVNWDGLDDNNKKVADGSYNYEVFLTNANGTHAITENATGKIENIIFQGKETFFTIRKTDDNSVVIANSGSLIMVSAPKKDEETENNSKNINPLDTIGGKVVTDKGVVQYEGSNVELLYNITGCDTLGNSNYISKINILDENNKIIKTINRNSEGKFIWDGSDNYGEKVSNGFYRYETLDQNEQIIENSLEGIVVGVQYENDKPYLNVGLHNTSKIALINLSDIKQVALNE